MEVIWRDGVDLVDGNGRVTPQGDALLRHEIHDERLAVATLLGSRATAGARRRLVAGLLGQPTPADPEIGPGAGVALLACVSYMEEDYRLLILDVGDASSPAIGPLCALSSLVLSTGDTETAMANALPAFPPFQETLQSLQRELSSIEIYDMLPTMLSVDFSSDASLQHATSATADRTPLTDMTRLKTMGVRSVDAVAAMDVGSLFTLNAPVKKLFGTELTGEVLLALLQSLAQDTADGHDPELTSAWDEFVERKCTAVADDALATYADCIQSSLGSDAPPIDLHAFEKLHDELWRLAMDVFHNGAAAWKGPSRRAVRNKLKSDLKQKHAQELETLRANSRRYCDRVRADVWHRLSTPLLESAADSSADADSVSSAQSFRAALEAIHQFDEAYGESAKGPEKAAVLTEFYRKECVEIFQRLEGIVSRRMTDAHLRELREQLEKDFEAKKEALVDHFKQEEAQLRVCMAREMEMMQKLHQAKSSRVKIDESETKRLRDEVVALRSAKAALESRQVVLEHASEHAEQQNRTLEAKMRDLENAVRHEMASRSDLVETLATTIKTGEENERQLQDRIEQLRTEVAEKASRIENELRDLTAQLRKTSEEKDELQKKLNEFFLRVTALPAALQQHLFSMDAGDGKPVGFADALSSYMSE